MLAGFVVNGDRSGHPDLSRRMAWSLQVPTVIHLEMPMETKLDAVAQTARAAIAVATAGRRTLQDLVSQATVGVKASAQGVGGNQNAGSPKVEKFLADIAKLDCAACTKGQLRLAGTAPAVCCHDELGDPLVVENQANDPACLQFATDMFEKLVGRAGDYYAAITLGNASQTANSPPTFGTLGQSNMLSLRFATTPKTAGDVDGTTWFPPGDASGARQAEVTIQLPADLDALALGELPYVMFHELFVHGPESWYSDGRRIATRSTCAMREGFVDAAAAFVLAEELTLKGLSFSSFPGMSERLAADVKAAHRMRSTPASAAAAGRDQRLAMIRLTGSANFDRYVDRKLGKTAVSLAAAINLLDTSEEDRGTYLGILGEAALLMVPEPALLDTPEYRLSARLRQIADRRPVDLEALKNTLAEWKSLAFSDF